MRQTREYYIDNTLELETIKPDKGIVCYDAQGNIYVANGKEFTTGSSGPPALFEADLVVGQFIGIRFGFSTATSSYGDYGSLTPSSFVWESATRNFSAAIGINSDNTVRFGFPEGGGLTPGVSTAEFEFGDFGIQTATFQPDTAHGLFRYTDAGYVALIQAELGNTIPFRIYSITP